LSDLEEEITENPAFDPEQRIKAVELRLIEMDDSMARMEEFTEDYSAGSKGPLELEDPVELMP